jgi:hypothetical protein
MAQQRLDSPQIDPFFQEMGGIRMPEGVAGYGFWDLALLTCGF